MSKTIYEKIMERKITSLELKSVLGRELYTYSNRIWFDAFKESDYTYTPEQFCQYIADYVECAEREKFYLKIQVGKAKHSELFDYGCIPVMYPSTNELSLLWKGNKKLKKCLFVPIKGPDYELTVNMFTGEVVEYVDMDIIEGNFN